jgi:hypothetical protein
LPDSNVTEAVLKRELSKDFGDAFPSINDYEIIDIDVDTHTAVAKAVNNSNIYSGSTNIS